MESDAAVEMLKNAQTEDYRVSTIISDEDSTTMARVGREVNHDVKKVSDVNHCKKTLGNDLYEAKKRYKCLSEQVMKYIT